MNIEDLSRPFSKGQERPTAAGAGASFDPPDFVARFPWLGGDLQTLRNFIVRPRPDLSPWPARRVELALDDGSGDRLLAVLQENADGAKPLVVLVHGLTGCQDSFYVLGTTRLLLEQGYPVLRLNLRGAGPGRPLARRGYNAGSSADLAAALRALGAQDGRLLARGLALVGYSLGGNILLKFLAEAGRELPVVAAASVSAPIDLKATQVRIMAARNRVYHAYLLSRMKAELLATPGGVLPEVATRARRARSVLAFDDTVVAPAAGFNGAEDYYARCSAQGFLPAIEVPALLLHARDDPWIPAAAYDAAAARAQANLRIRLAPGGGHVGFHGKGSRAAWHDRTIAAFFDRSMAD
ncbi:MAG: alpha/beta fold hydrolase [Kiloniellales bacterium]|nr:alpha/beta fold hydrolase [Kiloniellales bacterium]